MQPVWARTTLAGEIHQRPAHAGHVEEQRVVGHRQSGDVVAAPLDAEGHLLLASEVHRRNHVSHPEGADHRRRAAVDHRVPDRAGIVVAGGVGEKRDLPEPGDEGLRNRRSETSRDSSRLSPVSRGWCWEAAGKELSVATSVSPLLLLAQRGPGFSPAGPSTAALRDSATSKSCQTPVTTNARRARSETPQTLSLPFGRLDAGENRHHYPDASGVDEPGVRHVEDELAVAGTDAGPSPRL